MDSSAVEHSDSDSGESWTLLENSPTYGDEAADTEIVANEAARERENADLQSENDDTDGISIISDSEPESSPCDLNYVRIPEENPADQLDTTLTVSPPTDYVPMHETDFLGDNVKYKTYVHKRNPKVGSILDIIMLGTFVITAGMALGHLWSCKNECTSQTSVNKILSNLYKLQEENAFLRSKLKEITEATSYQLAQQRKSISKSNKQFRCKKIFEDPVMKNNKGQSTIKCVDDKPEFNHLAIPEHEKEFLNDVNKMKDIYVQNKDWLDKEVKRQFEDLEKSKKGNIQLNMEEQLGPVKIPLNPPDILQDIKKESDNRKTHKQINLEKQLRSKYFEALGSKQKMLSKTSTPKAERRNPKAEYSDDMNAHDINIIQPDTLIEKKITYADSLKIDQPLLRSKRSEPQEPPYRSIKEQIGKRKHRDDDDLLNLNIFSDDDIKKDDRYTGPKLKYEKKKHDRQKSHKRQKRNNKYEQWEMKGGYMKDFDEFSVTSSLDNISINKPERKFLNTDFENYVNRLIEAENNASNKDLPKITKNVDERLNKSDKRALKSEKRKRGKTKDLDWFDQRTALRAEARMKVEQELFGENTSNAGWYFRRMQKREQCRAQKDNSTFKKFSKRKMNFKMKR